MKPENILPPKDGEIAPTFKPTVKMAYVKAVDTAKKTVTSYVSTYNWDRMGERFAKGSWNLDNFMKNPVVLWSHDNRQPPIGRAIDITEDDNGLASVTEFDPQSDFAMEVFSLYERGFLHAFSVGFNPKTWMMEDIQGTGDKGIVFTDQELLEYSAVSIPANPGAVVSREVAAIVTKALGEGMLERVEDRFAGERFLVKKPEIIVTKAEVVAVPDFTEALKGVVDFAKAARGQKLDAPKLAMLKTTMDVLHAVAEENQTEPSKEQIGILKGMVDEYAAIAAKMCPDMKENIRQAMTQLDRALRTGRLD